MSEPLTLRATGALTLPDAALTRLTALEHGLFAICAGAAGAGLLLGGGKGAAGGRPL